MHKPLKFPYKIEPGTELDEKWKRLETVKIVTDSKILRISKYFPNIAESIYNFKVRADDVWVITFPKSGTTLTQEMVWMIVNDDYETAKRVPLIKRFPFLEIYSHIPQQQVEEVKKKIKDHNELKEFEEIMTPQWITLENNPNRRFIKTHLQFPLLPPDLLTSGCKILYVARNPKDAALSMFKFLDLGARKEDFQGFWNLFQNDCLEASPYWDHVIQGWNQRKNNNVCFMFYEDIIKDMRGAISKVADFMGKSMSEEEIEKLSDHLNIENFRKNTSVSRLYSYYMRRGDTKTIIRKGIVGDWKEYFNDEVNAKANKWIEENYKRTDLRFPVNLE